MLWTKAYLLSKVLFEPTVLLVPPPLFLFFNPFLPVCILTSCVLAVD